MSPSTRAKPRDPPPAGPAYWTAYFDALATGPLLAKPHTARRRAGEGARMCPYPEVAVAGLAKVRSALEARDLLISRRGRQSASASACARSHARIGPG